MITEASLQLWNYILGGMFILAGLFHFIKPAIYLRIMPLWLPGRKALNLLSGLLEIVFGILVMLPQTREIGAWGLIALLLLFFIIHGTMLMDKRYFMGLPLWARVGRFVLQFFLIYWVWLYT